MMEIFRMGNMIPARAKPSQHSKNNDLVSVAPHVSYM